VGLFCSRWKVSLGCTSALLQETFCRRVNQPLASNINQPLTSCIYPYHLSTSNIYIYGGIPAIDRREVPQRAPPFEKGSGQLLPSLGGGHGLHDPRARTCNTKALGVLGFGVWLRVRLWGTQTPTSSELLAHFLEGVDDFPDIAVVFKPHLPARCCSPRRHRRGAVQVDPDGACSGAAGEARIVFTQRTSQEFDTTHLRCAC
jgi:hypothetical protein